MDTECLLMNPVIYIDGFCSENQKKYFFFMVALVQRQILHCKFCRCDYVTQKMPGRNCRCDSVTAKTARQKLPEK